MFITKKFYKICAQSNHASHSNYIQEAYFMQGRKSTGCPSFSLTRLVTTLWLRSFRTDQRDTPKCEFWGVNPTKTFWFNTFWLSNLSFMCVDTLMNNEKMKLLFVTLEPNLLCELSNLWTNNTNRMIFDHDLLDYFSQSNVFWVHLYCSFAAYEQISRGKCASWKLITM